MKFVLRRWRGDGNIIPDILKDKYQDYHKKSMNRNARSITLAECIVQVINEEDFLKECLLISKDHHNKMVKKYFLGKEKLIK